MDINVLLSSIITASSILIAVGFPFIIFISTNYQNRRENLLSEIKTYYPKLNAFRRVVYLIYSTGSIKQFERALQQAKTEQDKNEIKNDGAYLLYMAFNYIQSKYCADVLNDNNMHRIISHNEILHYQMYARDIYNYIINRHDTEINRDRLKDIMPYKKQEINQAISDIDPKYSKCELTIELIGTIAGNIDQEVTNILENLTINYERPLHSIVKKLLRILTISAIIGILIPLLLLLFPFLQICLIPIALVTIFCICFIWIIRLTWNYVLKKPE